MKKILMTCLAAAVFAASGYTVHRSFKNGYPTGSGPGRSTGVSVGVNGASFTSQDGAEKEKMGKEKLKDDGTCWAITANGTRCKNRKDGEKDYCKLHAADRRVRITPNRCRALTYEGTRCSRAPEPGYNFCKQHGAPAPKK
jgi:hypothetical protein